jgi:PPK2 family polyphosphate:nucleotide phosphotransferase
MKKLKNIPTAPKEKYTKKECNLEMAAMHKKLFALQNVFYADARFALLIVIQGMDTSGKDGTIRRALMCMSPLGVQAKSFKKPTQEELSHDFLWRVYPHFPAKGMIGVFNRSYYEDILVPKVENAITDHEIKQRSQLLNQLEAHLIKSGTHVLKFFLHISKEKQAARIQKRMTKPEKKWKYTKEDSIAAEKWDCLTAAYDLILQKCNQVPWHIIPADKRWYRNFAVAKVIVDHLRSLDLKYPHAEE